MNYSYLTIEHSEFKEKVNSCLQKGRALLTPNVQTEDDFKSFNLQYKSWNDDMGNLWRDSFALPVNDFLVEFGQCYGQSRSYWGNTPDLKERVEAVLETLRSKISWTEYNLELIGQCDFIRMGAKFKKPDSMKVQDKLLLILNRLSRLEGDGYHPVQMLLEGNGLKIRTSSEPRELVDMLESNGYVDILGGIGTDVNARITTQGLMYLEQQDEAYQEDYNDIPGSSNELNRKIDQIIEELNKQNLGHEILFEELQELKVLYGKLSKKNFGQLFKGKLIDLSLAKLIENDTIKFIYQEVTGHSLRIGG